MTDTALDLWQGKEREPIVLRIMEKCWSGDEFRMILADAERESDASGVDKNALSAILIAYKRNFTAYNQSLSAVAAVLLGLRNNAPVCFEILVNLAIHPNFGMFAVWQIFSIAAAEMYFNVVTLAMDEIADETVSDLKAMLNPICENLKCGWFGALLLQQIDSVHHMEYLTEYLKRGRDFLINCAISVILQRKDLILTIDADNRRGISDCLSRTLTPKEYKTMIIWARLHATSRGLGIGFAFPNVWNNKGKDMIASSVETTFVECAGFDRWSCMTCNDGFREFLCSCGWILCEDCIKDDDHKEHTFEDAPDVTESFSLTEEDPPAPYSPSRQRNKPPLARQNVTMVTPTPSPKKTAMAVSSDEYDQDQDWDRDDCKGDQKKDAFKKWLVACDMDFVGRKSLVVVGGDECIALFKDVFKIKAVDLDIWNCLNKNKAHVKTQVENKKRDSIAITASIAIALDFDKIGPFYEIFHFDTVSKSKRKRKGTKNETLKMVLDLNVQAIRHHHTCSLSDVQVLEAVAKNHTTNDSNFSSLFSNELLDLMERSE
eukprot:372942_1